jgi:hypothetical protein
MSEQAPVFKDIEKVCWVKGCGKTFTLTAGEQEFFSTKIDPETNEPLRMPSRCPDCRVKAREERMRNRQQQEKRDRSPFNAMRGKETPGMGVGVGAEGKE